MAYTHEHDNVEVHTTRTTNTPEARGGCWRSALREAWWAQVWRVASWSCARSSSAARTRFIAARFEVSTCSAGARACYIHACMHIYMDTCTHYIHEIRK